MDSQEVLDGRKTENNVKPEEYKYLEIEIPNILYQFLRTENSNIQNICRICLTTNCDVLYPLLTPTENSIIDMYVTLTTIRPTAEDGLPSSICEQCQTLVMQCYNFKLKCERSECLLRSILKGEFITKEEPPDDSMLMKLEDINEYNINVVKNETEIGEDVQYLEELSDEDNETLYKVRNKHTAKKERLVKLKDTNKYNRNAVKNKTEIGEDVQYLEELSDDDNETLYKVRNKFTAKKERRKLNNDVKVYAGSLNNIRSIKKCLEKKYKSYSCQHCSKVFLKAKTLNMHVKRKHSIEADKRPHPCSLCKESFDSEHDLLVHSALHAKGTPLKCNQCQKQYNTKTTLRRHIQRHMQFKPHLCTMCNKTFTELYALRRHIRVHTGERAEKKHACHICDKRYSESGQLAAHVARHAGARPCACAACPKRFASARLLASHMRVHADLRPYACEYCEKSFRHESTRNTHHRTHTGEKPYVCSVCGKNFIQNSNLTLHMRTHTGERPYSCTTCDRKFTSGSSLKNHQRIHTGERPYKCDICGKSFARVNMGAHMRQHTGERPFACSACPKKFVNASRLKEHCRIHTGEKPFECGNCTSSFTTKSHLIKHMKTHPPNKKINPKHELIIVQQVPSDASVKSDKDISKDKKELATDTGNTTTADAKDNDKNITIDMVQVPLEVSGELILQDDSNVKTELLVVDNSENNYPITNNDICLNAGNVNIINSEVNYGNDMNLVTVNEGGVSISASTLEGATVKLYQLDQSLLQIHSSSGQVTISKITSKMTTNF